MAKMKWISLLVVFYFLSVNCQKNDGGQNNDNDILQIITATAGDRVLNPNEITENIPVAAPILLSFNKQLDTIAAKKSVTLTQEGDPIGVSFNFPDQQKSVSVSPRQSMDHSASYSLEISNQLRGASGSTFQGITYSFITAKKEIKIKFIALNEKDFESSAIHDVDFDNITIETQFSEAINNTELQKHISITTEGMGVAIDYELSNDKKTLTVTNQEPLTYYRPYQYQMSSDLAADEASFEGFTNTFFTRLDSTNKFPEITDNALLTKVQHQTFKYFWEYGHPESGMARERYGSGNTVTTGGSGFGMAAIIVGIERGFITREQGINRLEKIVSFLESADRFHGAWPHWLNGNTGEVIPFSPDDDGADLVETAFLMQGLLTFRQYLNPGATTENELISRIDTLWETVEWDWFTNNEEVLYWHWSPNGGFKMNMQISGYNETLITYILAAASPTHSIDPEVYHNGYARNGNMTNGQDYYGYTLPVGFAYGGPLFFAHYSFMGLNPQNLSDDYADYWQQNVNHSLINQAYCIENPKNFIGYSEHCWGLTASDNHEGYSAHSPTNDLGVITPTAAISSIPYTPEESMKAIKHFYYKLGDRMWGEYGFHDAFNISENWYADSYIAIDQGPIIVMIENHRTGLLWDLFMTHPDVGPGLDKLNFNY